MKPLKVLLCGLGAVMLLALGACVSLSHGVDSAALSAISQSCLAEEKAWLEVAPDHAAAELENAAERPFAVKNSRTRAAAERLLQGNESVRHDMERLHAGGNEVGYRQYLFDNCVIAAAYRYRIEAASSAPAS